MHVANYSSSDREVIRFLFAGMDWSDLYDLHIQFRLSPGQALDIVERLVTADFAELDGTKARLTTAGRTWVLEARNRIFRGSEHEAWRARAHEIPDNTKDTQSPYMPDLSLVDQEFFIKLALNGLPGDATTESGGDSTVR